MHNDGLEQAQTDPKSSGEEGQVFPEGRVSQDGSPVIPEKPFNIGAALRNVFEQYEKQAYSEWIGKLTPEEMATYEKMGFHFQLLRAICQNHEMIALSADENELKRFSFFEVVQLVKDLKKMAVDFLGQELHRKPNPNLEQFVNAYKTLKVFLVQKEKIAFTEVQEDATLTATPYIDQDLLKIIEKTMPPDMVTLIKSAEISEGTNGKIERNEVKTSFTKMVVALQLTEPEKEQFVNALRVIAKIRQKILDNKPSNIGSIHLQIQDLRDMVEALGKMECLRRVYPSNPELDIYHSEKLFGLSEIYRLAKFIISWEKTFRWLGQMQLGKAKVEKILPDNEIANEDEESIEDMNEKRRETIKNFMDSFSLVFPDPLAPMIVKRHREVLRRRIQNYPALAVSLNGITDDKTKKDLKRVLFQISTILSYLDYMWNMHEVRENEGGKHIVYPKKMILLGPLILQETEELAATLNFLSEQYRGTLGTGEDDLDDIFGEKKPAGLGINFEESNIFKLGPDSIISMTRNNALATADAQTDEDKQRKEQKEKLADSLNMIGYVLSVSIKTARQNLRATSVKNVLVNEEKTVEGNKAVPQTLSYDIHDFINDLRDAFSAVLFEMARIFNNDVSKHDVLPEIAAQEEQAAQLRGRINMLGERIKPTAEVMAFAMVAAPEQMAEDIIPGLKAIVTNLAAEISDFQRYQEYNLNEKKYHEVLRGAGYEKLVRLANAIEDFDTNYNEQLDGSVLDLFILRKRLEEFAEKTQMGMNMGKFPRNGILGAWIKDLELLKKVEDRILINGLKQEEMQELQIKYVERFMHVLNIFYDICHKQTVVHSIPDGSEEDVTTLTVSPEIREHFQVFFDANPLVQECMTEKFTSCFHKFYRLMHLMSDFSQVCDFQLNANTAEQEFLKEYDMKKAKILEEECKKLLEADYVSTDRLQKNKLMLSLAACREALGHLLFRAPEEAEILDIILNDMENTVRIRYEQGKPIHPEDLETFYLQFIREQVENPITVRY